MKFSLKNKKFFSKKGLSLMIDFFGDKIKPVVFTLFLALAGYCFYVWYHYVYNPSWSSQEKEAYVKSVDKDVTFDKKNFQAILEKVNARKERYQQDMENIRDIFHLE